MKEQCSTCRYRNRTPLEKPCDTGIHQLNRSGWCHQYRRSWWTWLKKVINNA